MWIGYPLSLGRNKYKKKQRNIRIIRKAIVSVIKKEAKRCKAINTGRGGSNNRLYVYIERE